MDAAERLFLERGVAATSIDDIALAAGAAKGTLYLYFPAKEKLLAALQERYIRSFSVVLRRALDRFPAGDWTGRLQAWVRAAVAEHFARISLHAVVFHDAQVSDPRLNSENPVMAPLIELLEAGAKAGAWPVRDARMTAVMLFHAMHGAVDEAAAVNPRLSRTKLTAAIVDFFNNALAVTPR